MNGQLVGSWRLVSGHGQEFAYAESWVESPHARPLSLSMPLRPSGAPYRQGVQEFFENLLPDNADIRERIRRRFNARSTGAFDLLLEIGRDCVGALLLAPEGAAIPDIRQITGHRKGNEEVARLLAESLDARPGRGASSDEGFRLSIAGAQEKTALLRHEGQWMEPTGATPTTHILKLPMGISGRGIDLSTSIENEWLCGQIAKGFGIEVANSDMERFGEQRVLVVERFDRKLAADGRWMMRLPQEDFCQATGTPPDLKYESDGGPGIKEILELLRGSDRSEEDRKEFMRAQVLFWLLAAIDGHAKNFSIFHLAGSAYRLTPLYDILSAYPILGHGRDRLDPEKIRMAMAVTGKNRHYEWGEIHARHFLETAQSHGVEGMRPIMEELASNTARVIDQVQNVLPKDFPGQVAETIIGGLEERAAQLKEELD